LVDGLHAKIAVTDGLPGTRLADVAATYLAADTCRMAKQPTAPPLYSFDVYKIASKAVWLASIEASDERDAIERIAK
jgi:hypothetical protein